MSRRVERASVVAPEVAVTTPVETIVIIEDDNLNNKIWMRHFFKRSEIFEYDENGIYKPHELSFDHRKVIIAKKWSDALENIIRGLNPETDTVLLDQDLQNSGSPKHGDEIYRLYLEPRNIPVVSISSNVDFCRRSPSSLDGSKTALIVTLNEKIKDARAFLKLKRQEQKQKQKQKQKAVICAMWVYAQNQITAGKKKRDAVRVSPERLDALAELPPTAAGVSMKKSCWASFLGCCRQKNRVVPAEHHRYAR